MAAAITTVVILCFFGVGLTHAVGSGFGALGLAECGALMLVLLGLQLCHSFPSRIPGVAGRRRITLSVQAVLTFLPFLAFGAAWLGMPGFLAASCLLVLRPTLAWSAFALVVAATGGVQFAVGYGVGDLAYNLVATILTGLVVYGLSLLSSLIGEVQAARDELVRLTLAQERVRFARDLHDLLGFSLATITLKCELTQRLMSDQPARAEQELAEVVQASRQALKEVRSVASSYLRMSLEREVAAASSLLRAIGIHAEMRMNVNQVPPAVDIVLAAVLREGITNVLRHSKAQKCVVEAGTDEGSVHLKIVNDGLRQSRLAHIPQQSGDTGPGGIGLSSLAERARGLGGRLTSGERADGLYELIVVLPVRAGAGAEGDPLTATPPRGRSVRHPSGSGH
ncbi:hypothetical protein GCM10010329_64130 [Streptomyces spiroverticillatus]|uniref:Signal transduction histidine kinase subgroup 3 dimerisation and phosphoacceptor domain-containing protein n=1 Tax=Streptomyces finlayi TaxID=67296 RepID=A0A918X4F7_9ACTN|nr:histidine kinase [Streptomyces finlayi]GHA31964.1 hypothetical protein GCM10010329_64130 [Streptomyces spiroverticillatus]GHD10809.1 hypothetical protein GCM10010334_66420 [Streptomyces finlayi]